MAYLSSLESEEQERKLFVGGLNKSHTDEPGLKKFFEKFGPIIDVTIMRDGDKQSRGFGFVLFETSTAVDDIISAKKEGNNFSLDDHHIEVKRALPKVPGGNAGTSRTGGMYRKIFVGGLPSTVTEDDLRKHFERFGRISEVELLRCRETNRLRGFAFVTFEDEDSADKCIQRRTHEICKKICEVKRAQTRSTLTKYEHGDHSDHPRRRDYHDDRNHNANAQHAAVQGGGIGMNEVNQLIQQAFLMGQQSVLQPSAVQAPTAASLLALSGGGGANSYAPPVNNQLIQALMGQQPAPSVPAPIAPPAAAPATSGAINQLAQLLQGRGIDPNALTSLLKQEQDATRPASQSNAKGSNNGGYTTTYPPTSAYDLYYSQQGGSSYGPSKEESEKGRGYRPY